MQRKNFIFTTELSGSKICVGLADYHDRNGLAE
jgi:hypothetical protein